MKRALDDEKSASTSKGGIAVKSSSKFRFGKCEVCAAQDARYVCPKCEVKTCCVRCVQIHKEELSCDGIRDRTKFVSLRKMTKFDFLSDYYFIEECTRYTYERKFDRIKQFTSHNKLLPIRLFRLRNAAGARGTTLHFLLDNFSRHKENTTYFDWNKKQIHWRVEWNFPNASSLKCVDELCAEDEPLHALLDKYVNAKSTVALPERTELEYYQSVSAFNLKVLLKAECVKRSDCRFYSLNVSQTLKDNLAGKTIVEFPRIFVCFASTADAFDIVDSDEDIESETKAYQRSLDNMRKEELLKKDNTNIASDDEDNDDNTTQFKKFLDKNQRKNSLQKPEELQKTPSNYLFTDESLWDEPSSEDDDNETAKDNTGQVT